MTTSTSAPTLCTTEAIEQRRSVKHYDASHVMPEADMNELIRLAMLSPTSFNIQNWRFVCVTDKALQADIKAASWNQAHVADCSMLVLMCADVKAWAKQPERYWANAAKEASDMMVPMIGQFYEGNEQLQRDEAMRSVGIASQTLMLAAKSMRYDSCPMIGFDPVKVAELINLPKDHLIGMMVAVGKPLNPAKVRGGQLPQGDVMIKNRF
jgi:nitroreductase